MFTMTLFIIVPLINDIIISDFCDENCLAGARIFLVMNVTPLGCNPSTSSNPYRTENRDEYACKVDYLTLVNMHNEHLVELLGEFRLKYPMADWILYDAYGIMLDGYRNPSKYGVEYPFKACCGYGGGSYNYNESVKCGKVGHYMNGTYAKATKCENPTLHIIWDSLHPVESFCRYLAQGVLNGTRLSPAFNISERFSLETQAQINEKHPQYYAKF
ncbi:hypothetical protein L7F22_053148 [Adiantum nelumboides]|nr:hypothetical protein [Adiantum nelumboides]